MSEVPPPSPICVDASVVAAILMPDPLSEAATRAWQSWLAGGRILVAPVHYAAEAVSAIRRWALFGQVSVEEETAALTDLLTRIFPLVEVPAHNPETWHRACVLARRELRRAGVYDTLYLAVAEEMGAEFWTGDQNLERALTADGRPLPPWIHILTP
ncbi:MAG: type II toxin-antitoxin system VapC family toxin [Armatimonadetes bacterium]|nr:type II toxin-antitoxin system VapC family toxin [Armatimonadota bacterium]